jgi:starch synthase
MSGKTSKKVKQASGLKVLFAVSEVAPFLTTGGMGQVVGALPAALKELEKILDIRVVCPLYEEIRRRFASDLTFLGKSSVRLAWRSLYCGLFKAELDGVTYYFVDNEYFFKRSAPYGFYDDGERFAFFSKAVFQVMEMTHFIPDVIHCHDWQTALVPVYLKTRFNGVYDDIRTVFTIHNIEYQGKYNNLNLGDIFDLYLEEEGLVEYNGGLNLMKGAIVCCDNLTTVSPTYAEEIQVAGGFGLEPIIRENAYKLHGIINGIDTRVYDPATNPSLEKNYSVDTIEHKAANKLRVQSLFRLPKSPRTMLICVVSRLVSHKGMDLITYIMDDLLQENVQFLLLGTGNHAYELYFSEMAMRYPDKVGVNIAFNPEMSDKIYAGADITLMPSASEPCGLAQMIACRYGTVPIVRETGGLKDTIIDCRNGRGNGFVFKNYNAHELLETIRDALDFYTYRENDWRGLMREGMRTDFSWTSSAVKYAELYNGLKG